MADIFSKESNTKIDDITILQSLRKTEIFNHLCFNERKVYPNGIHIKSRGSRIEPCGTPTAERPFLKL